MNFTNINDPAGVKALLDQLRHSQAWQEAISSPTTSTAVPHVEEHSAPHGLSSTSNSVQSLLSQLQSSSSLLPGAPSAPETYGVVSSAPPLTASATKSESVALTRPKQDVKRFTFHQALPHLAQLSEDPRFVDVITKMKREQAELERQLWEERRSIQLKYEEKVKVARTKANMMGVGLSKHEAEMISDSYQRELHKFDQERVLPAWDGVLAKQQTALENEGVPTMYMTTEKTDRERQQKIVQVLEGVACDSNARYH